MKKYLKYITLVLITLAVTSIFAASREQAFDDALNAKIVSLRAENDRYQSTSLSNRINCLTQVVNTISTVDIAAILAEHAPNDNIHMATLLEIIASANRLNYTPTNNAEFGRYAAMLTDIRQDAIMQSLLDTSVQEYSLVPVYVYMHDNEPDAAAVSMTARLIRGVQNNSMSNTVQRIVSDKTNVNKLLAYRVKNKLPIRTHNDVNPLAQLYENVQIALAKPLFEGLESALAELQIPIDIGLFNQYRHNVAAFIDANQPYDNITLLLQLDNTTYKSYVQFVLGVDAYNELVDELNFDIVTE